MVIGGNGYDRVVLPVEAVRKSWLPLKRPKTVLVIQEVQQDSWFEWTVCQKVLIIQVIIVRESS